MATLGWIIELEFDRWQLFCVAAGDCTVQCEAAYNFADLLDQCARIRDALHAQGHDGNKPVLVAPGSTWCLVAQHSRENGQQARHRQSMLYHLEEYLPLAAEEVVADWVVTNGSALCVAVPIEPLKSFVDELVALGIQVATISPMALLATQSYAESLGHDGILAWRNGVETDLITVDGGRPVSWKWLPDGRGLEQEVSVAQMDGVTFLREIAWSAEAASYIAEPAAHEVYGSEDRVSYSQCLALTAGEILSGQTEPWIELRRDALRGDGRRAALRPYLKALEAAAAVFVFAVCAAMLLRGNEYTRIARALRSQQAQVYSSVFPNSRFPAGIVRRLQSELARLEGVSGQAVEIAEDQPALEVLAQLVVALPEDRRFRLNEVRIENGRVYLDGEVREHSDAEAISRLLKTHGFTVSAPNTHRLEGERVSFRITGSFAPSTPVEHIAQRGKSG